MSYTRPTYNADTVTWLGASSYTRPIYSSDLIEFGGFEANDTLSSTSIGSVVLELEYISINNIASYTSTSDIQFPTELVVSNISTSFRRDDGMTLTPLFLLEVSSTVSSTSLSEPLVEYSPLLIISNSLVSNTISNIELIQSNNLLINNSRSTSLLPILELNSDNDIVIQNVLSSSIVSEIDLIQNYVIYSSSTVSSTSIEGAVLGVLKLVEPFDSIRSTSLQSLVLSQNYIIGVEDVPVGSFSSSTSLTEATTLSISDTVLSPILDNLDVDLVFNLTLLNTLNGTNLLPISLTQNNIVVPNSITSYLDIVNILLNQSNILLLDNNIQDTMLSNINPIVQPLIQTIPGGYTFFIKKRVGENAKVKRS